MRKNKKNKGIVDTTLNLIIITVLSVIVLFATNVIIFAPSEGVSMEPTYVGNSYKLGLNTFLTGIKRGDVVMADFTISGKVMGVVKRVIGLPGEHVYWDGSNVYINGELLIEDDYETVPMGKYGEFEKKVEIQLGSEEYFLMGDNRPRSGDSRVFGALTLPPLP